MFLLYIHIIKDFLVERVKNKNDYSFSYLIPGIKFKSSLINVAQVVLVLQPWVVFQVHSFLLIFSGPPYLPPSPLIIISNSKGIAMHCGGDL